jgi:hypothetical protein
LLARGGLLFALVLALAAVVQGIARADGDPASDFLYFGTAFFPYSSPVGKVEQGRLNGVVAAARRAGYPIKVAVIAQKSDLGAVPGLFGKPQQYAEFLAAEIALGKPGRLLVVMPAGYGYAGIGAKPGKEGAALAGLAAPGTSGDQLTGAATAAVVALARAAGHPVAAPAGLPNVSGTSHSGSSSRLWILVGIGLAVLLGVVVLTALSRRGRRAPGRPSAPG